MLVMAALRGSDARAIFNAADSDGDGSLTFQEWLAWLQRGSRNKDIAKLDFSTLPNQSDNGKNNGEQQQKQLDPSLTNSLGLVLSHAVSTLKVSKTHQYLIYLHVHVHTVQCMTSPSSSKSFHFSKRIHMCVSICSGGMSTWIFDFLRAVCILYCWWNTIRRYVYACMNV